MKTPPLPDNNLGVEMAGIILDVQAKTFKEAKKPDPMDYFVDTENMRAIRALINSQVLKALDEVEETVIGKTPKLPDSEVEVEIIQLTLRKDQRDALNQLRERYTK